MLSIELVECFTIELSSVINSQHLNLFVNLVFYKSFKLFKPFENLIFLPRKIQSHHSEEIVDQIKIILGPS